MSGAVGPLRAVRLVTADAARLAAFYRDAFGFESGPDLSDRLGEGAVRALTRGGQTVELLTPATPEQPYPPAATSADTIFQHIALVVPQMPAAMARLAQVPGWTPISTEGPERLPDSSGAVTAFKFRDPEGHPLELLQFAEGRVPPAWQSRDDRSTCLGYDHSAITVADTAASVAFYARLGLVPQSRSLNRGVEQARMDAVTDAVVEVTGLRVPQAPPHLELLCYRKDVARAATRDTDIAATRLVFAVENAAVLDDIRSRLADVRSFERVTLRDGTFAARLRDPDGHRLWLVPQTG